ncbi:MULTISPECIES: VirB4 family type IV secretion/conjugal transfer ATPase [Pseudochrobactrum]|uniref:Type IV secretion system protein virB4 n=1 Tax=Pseudochrobactrum kiredjianiae TaxID=386305 RepID=A0ABW3V0V6_9HYPH|nr:MULTISPECIES: VirB4 family type IV secretion/conjugal transfer ATPase [Pseudochrobactrum]MDM7852979.1 VirB4 family type IV secretion/conjugal transfer ATPase [Pseudochrobactrum kiredjianiae]MDP8250920.1 VirB4 family type IV secretion/conjugal transfer ATPase [Pseudochrobactrum saccharolyticum]QVQ45780.1 VirB4 family type IV secretion/conjugal transfer ATPase [Pseudochrobactrum algeriensis]
MLKVVREELGLGKVAHNERPMSYHLPYMRHVSEQVIALEDGSLMCVIKLNGLFFQTVDQSELNLRNAVQNTIIKALGSSEFSVWSTLIRREIKAQVDGEFEDEFSDRLNKTYTKQLRKKRMFTNELFLTILKSNMRGALGIADYVSNMLAGKGKHNYEARQEDITELEELLGNLKGQFEKYGAQPLGITYRNDEPYSEPCEFLNQILDGGRFRKMRLPRMGISSYIGSSRLHFGKRTMQIQGAAPNEGHFGAMISIKEYPPFTAPGMLDNLLQINHEFILTQSFTLSDKPIAQERISRLQRQIQASDEAGSSVETDIDEALNSLINQEAVFGTHHLSLLCLSKSLNELNKTVSDLGSCLTETNINWIREDLNLEASFWAQMPGNHAYIARKSMLSSANFAGLSSLHNFASGRSENLHWGTPISLLETTSQTPFFFNFHQRDVGHFTITGPTGSGKTVVLNFLLSQARRVSPTPRAAFFDKDRGAEIFIRAIGGNYETLNAGEKTGFNPLHLDNNSKNREFLFRLLKVMLSSGTHDFAQEDKDTLEYALNNLMSYPLEQRNLNNLQELLSGRTKANANDLSARLRPWIDGEKAWVFNSQRDVLDFSTTTVFGFDMTSILDIPEVRTPVLMYLFHRFDEMLNGDPVMFFMDEGWKLLEDEEFSSFIVDKMKTIRKLNGLVGFGTQSAADITKAKASHTIIEQSALNIHFPNPRADEESYIKRFGLSIKEFQYIKNTAPESRSFLIKQGNDSVIARLDLSKMPDLIKVLSANKATLDECTALREKVGNDPKHWLPIFCDWENNND